MYSNAFIVFMSFMGMHMTAYTNMHAYEYNKNDEMGMMLRRTGIVEPIFLQMCGLCVITHLVTQEGSTMSNCKTCSQEISWDAKKREVLKIRGS